MRSSRTASRVLDQALAWEAKLRRPSISTQEVRAFRDWLDDETHASAWDRLAAERYHHDRFVVRRDADGFSIVDLEAAPIADVEGEPSRALSGLDAKRTAQRLNREELDRRLGKRRTTLTRQ